MRKKRVQFDPWNYAFRKVPSKIWKVCLSLLGYFFITFTIAVLLYLLFALFFKTDTERRLKKEIRMYEKIYPTLAPRQELLRDALTNLQYKDDDIYEIVFHSNAPAVNPMMRPELFNSSDSIPVTKIVAYTRDKADSLMARAFRVEETFEKIFRSLTDSATVIPPMAMPLKGITYPQVGASVGSKINPYLKAYVYHDGLDFIVTSGTPVYAPADGTVLGTSVSKNEGKVIEISHPGGYVTRFAHLETMSVIAGSRVKTGQKIGTVGVSGQSFAPHLHYEILRNGQVVDPVHCLFASVSPDEYANMLYMSVNTMQSMD